MQLIQIRNLLFDLGGVLYRIDIDRFVSRLTEMLKPDAPAIDYGKNSQHDFFSLLDKGEIEIEDFADGLREAYQLEGSQAEVMEAWRILLDGLYPGREAVLGRIGERYPIALLSNTNRFHYEAYHKECAELFGHFDKLFFSFEMQMRKPDANIYETVLAQTGWRAEETLFIDDSLPNIKGAEAVGLQTFWLKGEEDWQRLTRLFDWA